MPRTTVRFRILPLVALMTGAALLAGCSDNDKITKTTTTEQTTSTMPAPAQSSTTTTTTSEHNHP
jgi:outer membrane murein-binding lipoprotein Lpp